MSDGADLSFDEAKLAADADRLVRRYLSAATGAVAGTTRGLEKKLEAATQAAVPGKLYRAWQSSAYPETGPARNPVGTIWLKGGARTRGAVKFWTEPGAVRGKGGQYLAVPLPAAGSRGRARDLTPGEWERANGVRLVFVYRRGRPSLLVAKGTTNGRSGVFRPITRGRTAADGRRGYQRGEQSVPIFVLLPMVKHRNAFAIAPMVNASEGEMAREFFARVNAA